MNFNRIFVILALFFILIPSVLADLRAPSPGETVAFWAVLLIFNYIVNFVLIGIQSKIWLHLGFKKIAGGLAIITPIMFVVEGLILLGVNVTWRYLYPVYNNILAIFLLAVLNFGLIFANYFFLGQHFWNIDRKLALRTAIIMGILTNPALYYFFMFLYGNYLLGLFYNPPPPGPYGGPSPVPFSPPS